MTQESSRADWLSALLLQNDSFWLYGAAQESNLPSLGLPDLTGFEGLPK